MSRSPRRESASLKPRRYMISHLGCIHACMDRLGVEVAPAWLYGVTGYAFMINVPRGVSCAGPTAWNWQCISDRTPSLGIETTDYVLSFKNRDDFAEKKPEAIRFTRANCARGVPLYGAEFGFPEFYTVTGCDDDGFYRSAWCFGDETPIRTWDEFGLVDVGILFVGAVKRADGGPDDVKAISDALRFALDVGHAQPGYLGGQSVGLRAYDMWIESFHDGSMAEGPWCHPHGTTHNAACWHECRVYAEQFLRLCAARVPAEPGEGFVQAAEEYNRVHTALDRVRSLFPFDVDEALPSSETIEPTTTQLRKAREAEREGLAVLRQVSAMV